MEPLSAVDAAWFAMDRPTNPMVITAVLWFDGPVDPDLITRVVAERLVAGYPRFGQRVVARGLRRRRCWEADPDLDVTRHIHHEHLGPPGDRATLQGRVSELMSVPLPSDRPLWQVWILENGQAWAVVLRLHHSVADGVSLAALLRTLSDDAVAPVGGADAATRPRRTVVDRLVGLPELVHEAPRLDELARQAWSLTRLLLMPPDRRTALKGHLGGAKRAVWSEPVSLHAVRSAGREAGATVNDVLLAAVAGALGGYLAAHGGAPAEIRAMVPRDLRADAAVDRTLGNRFGMLVVPVPVGPVTAPQRLATIVGSTRQAKSSADGRTSAAIIATLGRLPRRAEHAWVGAFAAKVSVVVTDVAGPSDPVTLSGRRLLGVVGWAPASGGVSVTVTIFSYAGRVVLGVAADAAVVAHPEALVDGFHRELAALGVDVGDGATAAVDRVGAPRAR